jgi:putative phage-type endonuclease
MEQLSNEWFNARKGMITGSRVGAILGVNRFKTKEQLKRELVRDILGAPSEFTGNYATERGQALEPEAIERFGKIFGFIVEPQGFVVHPELPWLGASPDGRAYGAGVEAVVEVKCPMGSPDKSLDDESYIHQVQCELHCTGLSEGYLVVMDKNKDLHVKRIERDDAWIDKYKDELFHFYRDVQIIAANPDMAAQYLDDAEIDLTDHDAFREYKNIYEKAMAAKDEAEQEMQWAKERMEEMANGKKVICGNLTMYKTEKQGAISYAKAIKELLPDANLEAYRGKPTSYYTIKIKEEE